jgi:hypothetical protein
VRRPVVTVPVVVVVVVVASVLAWVAGADPPIVGRRNPPTELGQTGWRFVAITDGDDRWEVPPVLDTALSFVGRSLRARACNDISVDAAFHGSTIAVDDRRVSTAIGCSGDPQRADTLIDQRLMAPGEVAWAVERGVLHLSRDGVSADLVPLG